MVKQIVSFVAVKSPVIMMSFSSSVYVIEKLQQMSSFIVEKLKPLCMQWFINIIVVSVYNTKFSACLIWICQSQLEVQRCTRIYVGFSSRCSLSIATSVFLDYLLRQCCGGAMETQYNREETKFVKEQDYFHFYTVLISLAHTRGTNTLCRYWAMGES